MAGSFSCPPLQPISERCWHNYGVKWIRTYVEPEEQDFYYQHINGGVYRAAEVVREQVIDTAVNQASKRTHVSMPDLQVCHIDRMTYMYVYVCICMYMYVCMYVLYVHICPPFITYLTAHLLRVLHGSSEVLSVLSEPLSSVAANEGRWALSALHGMRYALCTVEFQDTSNLKRLQRHHHRI